MHKEMRKILFPLAAILLLSLPALPQEKKGGKNKKGAQAPAARFAGSIPGERASDPGKQSDHAAITYTSDGALWIAYLEWNDKDADRVLVRRRDPQGTWGAPIHLDDGLQDHYAPAIVSLGNRVLAVWPAQADGNFELFSAEVTPTGMTRKPERLTRAASSDINVRAAADAKGNVTIAWQSFRNGNADIYARRRIGTKWGKEIRISDSTASDWEPAIALDATGAAWISWDSYDHGNYDVNLRSLKGETPGPVIPVTTEPTADFHTSVAVDKDNRVWVAWDQADINWGKDFSAASSMPGSRGLHYSRSLGLRCYANGRLQQPASQPKDVFSGRMLQFAELPHLAVDAAGSLVLVFRHWTSTQPNEIYHFYAMRLEGGKWSEPWQFSQSSGHNSQHASLAANPKGAITVAYASDGRSATVLPTTQDHALHYVVYISEWPKAAVPANAAVADVTIPAAGSRSPRRPRHTMTVAGKTYTLLMGDCHRHTDIRGHSGVDGSILDTYRYAIDAAQLDFLGTSDHNEVTGGRWPDGLRDYQWYYTQKSVDLFTHSPNFTGIYSYEHSMVRPAGHRNVLFLKRGAPLRVIDRERKPEDSLAPKMWKFWQENVLTQPGQKSVIVPHTFGAGPLADWNWPNARFDCLLEIYQGARGSYEAWRTPQGEKRGGTQVDEPGHFAQDALAVGNTYGFISFSDHGSTHNSWAAVWAPTQDRKGVLDGMYDRRTYAATDEIILKVEAEGHFPGEEWQAAKAPRITASVEAPDQILRIDVVKNGKYVYTTRPAARTAQLSWQDSEPKSGKSYYYIRVFQRDAEDPQGDPEIAWSSPFYVTYP